MNEIWNETSTTRRRAALTFCNKIRTDLGLSRLRKLRPGIPARPMECPVARTVAHGVDLEVRVGMLAVYVGEYRRKYGIPEAVRAFLDDFDNFPHTLHPDLVAPEGRFVRAR